MTAADVDSVAPPERIENQAGSSHRADIQGLRGIAVLIVVLYHAGGIAPGGYIGVDVFFVISGFVIARSIAKEAGRAGRVDLVAFYRRRVRRLLPALAVMVSIVSVVTALVQSPLSGQQYGLRTALAASLSAANLYLYRSGGGYFSPQDENNPFVHTWSLGVEEQFYLVFPLVVFVVYWVCRNRKEHFLRVLTAVVLIGTAVSFALSVVLVAGASVRGDFSVSAERFAFYLPFTRAWQFGLGIVVATLAIDRRIGTKAAHVMGIVGLVLIVAPALLFGDLTPYPGLPSAIPTIGAAFVVLAPKGPAARLLSNRGLVWLGDLSYSWYLWHWPAIVVVRLYVPDSFPALVIAGALSIVPAALSYRFVEERFREKKTELRAPQRPRTSVLVACCLIVPIVAAGALSEDLLGLNSRIDAHPEFASNSIASDTGCLRPLDEPLDCFLGDIEDPIGTVLIVGDSHAAALSGAVLEAASAKGYATSFAGMAACPFLTTTTSASDVCERHRSATLELIERERPEVVVIANRSTLGAMQFELDRFEIPVQTRRASARGIDEWVDAYATTVADLVDLVGEVVVITEVPQLSSEVYENSLPTFVRPDGEFPRFDDEELTATRDAVLDPEVASLGGIAGVQIVDPASVLCSIDSCNMRDRATFLYRDHQHLSIAAQPLIVGLLVEPLDLALR